MIGQAKSPGAIFHGIYIYVYIYVLYMVAYIDTTNICVYDKEVIRAIIAITVLIAIIVIVLAIVTQTVIARRRIILI